MLSKEKRLLSLSLESLNIFTHSRLISPMLLKRFLNHFLETFKRLNSKEEEATTKKSLKNDDSYLNDLHIFIKIIKLICISYLLILILLKLVNVL
jgi:hypothetical protein